MELDPLFVDGLADSLQKSARWVMARSAISGRRDEHKRWQRAGSPRSASARCWTMVSSVLHRRVPSWADLVKMKRRAKSTSHQRWVVISRQSVHPRRLSQRRSGRLSPFRARISARHRAPQSREHSLRLPQPRLRVPSAPQTGIRCDGALARRARCSMFCCKKAVPIDDGTRPVLDRAPALIPNASSNAAGAGCPSFTSRTRRWPATKR